MYQFENFVHLLLFFLLGRPFYSCCYAVFKVFSQDLFFNTTKGSFDGIYLVEYVDAVLAVFYHSLNATDLPLNSP